MSTPRCSHVSLSQRSPIPGRVADEPRAPLRNVAVLRPVRVSIISSKCDQLPELTIFATRIPAWWNFSTTQAGGTATPAQRSVDV